MRGMKCLCVLRGVRGGPIYTSGGRFPPNAYKQGWLVGPDLFPCMHFAWHAHLHCQMGLPCKCVTSDAIFCVAMWCLLRVFILFHSCSSEMHKTREQLRSKVSDTNVRVRCIVYLYY